VLPHLSDLQADGFHLFLVSGRILLDLNMILVYA